MSVRLLWRTYTFVLLELLTVRTGCTCEAEEEEEGRGKQGKNKEGGAAGTELVAGQAGCCERPACVAELVLTVLPCSGLQQHQSIPRHRSVCF